VLLAVLALVLTPALGQRVYTTIKPKEVKPELSFDVNNAPYKVSSNVYEIKNTFLSSGSITDLNFSPSLVFMPDSQKAFIAFPNSDQIMAFNPKTGEILSFITVGKNPVQLVPLPDYSQIGVVCLEFERNRPSSNEKLYGDRVATIAMIDTGSYEVRTLGLTEVSMSIANNVAFSSDGSTGYVASASTDEVLRFDVATMQEIQPRLKLTPGVRPTALQMAPDGSWMGAVLVGSSNLSRTEHPDSIALVGIPGFNLIKTLSPPTGPNQTEKLLHDFTASTTLSFSPDGKFGVISDQAVSVLSQIPELATDRVWLWNLATDEFTTFYVGGMAANTFWTPTGEFLVVTALEIDFVDPVAKVVRRVSPLRSDFRPRTRPAFTADGKRMYIASPISDMVVVHELETREFPRFVDVGGEYKEKITTEQGNEIEYTFTSAPLELGLTPDNETLVSVNFNATTIDLLHDTTHYSIPRAMASAEFFTGIALTNPSSAPASVIATGFTLSGSLFVDDTKTTDVVEYVNPRTLTLQPGTQYAATSDELMVASKGGTVEGWFDIDSDNPEVRSFYLTGDRALKRLDGAVSSPGTSQKIVIPNLCVTNGMTTELTILNSNRQTGTVQATLFGQDGTQLATIERQVPSRGQSISYVRDPDGTGALVGMFEETAFKDWVDGYVVVTTDTGVHAYERCYDAGRLATLSGLPASSRDNLASTLYLPQVALFEGNDTVVRLVNINPKPKPTTGTGNIAPQDTVDLSVSVQISFKDEQGVDIAAPIDLVLTAGQSITKSVATLFSLQSPGQVVSGWLTVEANKPEVVGSAEYSLFSGKALSAIPLQPLGSDHLLFSHLAEGAGVSTGLALLNPGTSAASVTVDVHRSNGEINKSVELTLPGGTKVNGLLDDLIPGIGTQLGGFIQVHSSQNLVGLELFFADSLEYLAAVVPQ